MHQVLALSFREKQDLLDPLLRGVGVSVALAEGLPGEGLSNPGLQGYSLRAGPFTDVGRVGTLPITVLMLGITCIFTLFASFFASIYPPICNSVSELN